MEIKQLDIQTSVSDQLSVNDVAVLAKQGVDCIVCNRPDSEVAEQEYFEAIAQTAKTYNIDAVHIPFINGALAAEQTIDFSRLLTRYKRLHAYCRTGNRSTTIWSSAQIILGR